LDGAEALFGEGNYDSISMRDVAQRANVLLGVVTYHFGNKQALFEAVVSRRAEAVNNARLAELRRYDDPSVEQILDAFIGPILSQLKKANHPSYAKIMVQITQEERWSDLNLRLFRATAREFYDALQRAVPGVSPEVLASGLIYAAFVVLGAAYHNIRLSEMTDDAHSTMNFAKVYRSVLRFAIGGIHALADTASPVPQSKLPSNNPAL